jgi:hypothetical protein
VDAARELTEPLASMNLNPLYSRVTMIELGDRLLKRDGDYWQYYSHSDIEMLIASQHDG